ncbi:ISAs1 family transposase [Streptomyces sp. MI02-7b]|uniref:ISAs1 family transposase n=1 Tax=Streptomyces sp. MI02-7b TaxID=462941 RepID=UPI0039F489DD
MVAVLLTACAAVVAGAKSFAVIGQWARSAPQGTLARLSTRQATAFGVRIPPSAATIRRVVGAVCPGGLADLLGADPAGAQTLAVDGKTARGSRTAGTPAAHLLAAFTGTGQTVTQLRVPDKTNEITCFAALLAPYDLEDVTVTADALHTQRAHATYLVEEKKAHYAFTVKRNQKNLYRQLATLPWALATKKHYDRTAGHGRLETRVIQALTITELGSSTSRTPPRSPASPATAPTGAPANGPARPSTSSPTWPRGRHPRSVSRRSSGRSGASRTGSTSSGTPPTRRTSRRSAPVTAPRTRQPCAATRTTSTARQGTPTSLQPSAKPPTSPSLAPSISSASPDQHTYMVTATLQQPWVEAPSNRAPDSRRRSVSAREGDVRPAATRGPAETPSMKPAFMRRPAARTPCTTDTRAPDA